MRLAKALTLGLFFLLVFLLSAGLVPAAGDASVHHNEPPAVVDGLAFTENGLQFILQTAEPVVNPAGAVIIPGLDHLTQEPGAPQLPSYTTWIALPPGADLQIDVTAQELAATFAGHIRPAPSAVSGTDEATPAALSTVHQDVAPASRLDTVYQPDPLVYTLDAYYPHALYALSEPMYYRDVRLVQLTLYPVRYNPVAQTLQHARQIMVSATFTGRQTVGLRPAPSFGDVHGQALAGLVLNFDQAKTWRSLPQELKAAATALPVGVDVFKIEVNRDGIYEVSYEDLKSAGMNVDSVNPKTLQMLYRGEPVAYQFVGDSDTVFEPAEKIRFYGWAFDGSRLERQFITNNVFWLWAGGDPTLISQTPSQAGGTATNSFLASVTREPEQVWFATWTDQWDNFPNEPDAWYWDRIEKTTAAPLTRTYTVTLPYPAASGPEARFTAEFTSRPGPVIGDVEQPHGVNVYMNGHPGPGTGVWFGKQNVNITGTVPLSSVADGLNTFAVEITTTMPVAGGSVWIYLNRITVDYQRQLKASEDLLIFRQEAGGPRRFHLQGFGQDDPLIWNVSDPQRPQQITGASVSGSSGSHTFTFGGNSPASSVFVATTTGKLLSPLKITRYVPPNLDPPDNKADWVAISHGGFRAEVNRLANHRASSAFEAMHTHVVDVQDVINQYGYGLPIPAAIRHYLAYALSHWQVPPSYVLMVGDATVNPRHLTCTTCPDYWNPDEPQYALTDLVFKDRFQGQIPSDTAMAFLAGEDLLADVAIGRLSVRSAAETHNVVDKIIIYEQNLLSQPPWTSNAVFVSDQTDLAGNFCQANHNVGTNFPDAFSQTHLCYSDTISTPESLRAEMFSIINGPGAALLNYRGHGAIQHWGGSRGTILSTAHTAGWANTSRPVVVLSMDCLDGYFVYPGLQGLGETFLRLYQAGSAAHWSSTGLGTTLEHSVLHNNFYDGLFNAGQKTIGDAANYARLQYSQSGQHPSHLYSFLLQGDPAMRLVLPHKVLLPFVAKDATGP